MRLFAIHLPFAIFLFPFLVLGQLIPPEIPAGLGVNIHFTDPRPGEMEQLAAAGFKFIRMDFTWNSIEKKRGEYDFSAYDRLLAALEPHGIRAIFILDYSSRFYDNDLSPHSDEGRKAFARYAAAGAKHFKGRGILWEMYNEPNIHFWRPRPNVEDYIKLAIETGKALREAAPDEIYIGPALAGMDFKFLEACFSAGLLEYWSAVSVHPYRQNDPESAAADYRAIRMLIAKYAPKSKSIPVLCGEWGYTTVKVDENRQGAYLARQQLTNLANDVPLSIWYDWHDDGADPDETEHHFGIVRHEYHTDRESPYDAKPSYNSAKTLAAQLRGFRFNKQIKLARAEDHLLVFTRGDDVKLAAWTSAEPHAVTIPASAGTFGVVNGYGKKLESLTADEKSLSISLKVAPQYLTPQEPNNILSAIAKWERWPLETIRKREDPLTARAAMEIGGFTIEQPCELIVSNPLTLSMLPPEAGRIEVTIHNPAGEPFEGKLVIAKAEAAVRFENQKQTTIRLPTTAPAFKEFFARAELFDSVGKLVTATPTNRFVPLDISRINLAASADGDKKVASTQALAPSLSEIRPSMFVRYSMDPGWKYVRVHHADAPTLEGKPKAFGIWVKGDGSGNVTRLRFVDSTKQTFQPDGERLDFTDWRFIRFNLDANAAGHWGGAKDGVIHYPIQLETMLLIDSANREKTAGIVEISSPVLIYEE